MPRPLAGSLLAVGVLLLPFELTAQGFPRLVTVLTALGVVTGGLALVRRT